MATESTNSNESKSSVCFFSNQLYYNNNECTRIPDTLGKIYGAKVSILDLSDNHIKSLAGLEPFSSLEELILDRNQLDETTEFPRLDKLHTLCLNKNKIGHLEKFVKHLATQAPNIKYLSMLGNPACPDQLSDVEKDQTDYQRYRYYVIYCLPQLKFLDSTRVTQQELDEALKRGKFLKVARPGESSTKLQTIAKNTFNIVATFSGTTENIALAYTPLPATNIYSTDHKGAFGKCKHRYSGKHSEGNRFIRNSDL